MPDDPEDIDPTEAGKPVGYGSPPYEHRWPKRYCPNPKGRPRKEKAVTTTAPLSAFQSRVLEEANRQVAIVDGKPFTVLDRLMLQLRTSDRPEDRKEFRHLIREAMAADHAWWQEAVQDLLAYKEHWGPIFRQRRALGRKRPEVYPDPDDIIILSDIRFTFVGPVTAEEAADWQIMKRGRETFVHFANELIQWAAWPGHLENCRQHYLKLRRLYYRVNRVLPADFKKKYPIKFPPFVPPTELPPGYDHDEWTDGD